jgi:hypothetical protein
MDGGLELSIQNQTSDLWNSIDEIRLKLSGISLQLLFSIFASFAFAHLFFGKQSMDFFHWWQVGRSRGLPLFSVNVFQWLAFYASLVTAYLFHLRMTILIRLMKFKKLLGRKFGYAVEKGFFEYNWISEWRVYSLNGQGRAPNTIVRPFGNGLTLSLIASRALFLFYLVAPVSALFSMAWALLSVNFLLGMVDNLVAVWMAGEILAMFLLPVSRKAESNIK